jgi:hypothetical protein
MQVGGLCIDAFKSLPQTNPGSTVDAALPHHPLMIAHPLYQVPIGPLVSYSKELLKAIGNFALPLQSGFMEHNGFGKGIVPGVMLPD